MRYFRLLCFPLIILIITISLVACSSNNDDAKDENTESILVVTSFTLIEDMVQHIGGDYVKTHNLVPTGTDPHEYEPLPEDTKAITDAEAIIYNGFNLEGGEDGWLAKMVDTAGKSERSEEHTSELQSRFDLVCRLLLEKKK